ncbi:MAG: (Fe-S)-binding protein, partial [Polyangiales bacterium]
MLALLVALLGFFAWTAARRLALLTAAKPEPRFSIEGSDLGNRIRDTFIYAFGQKKMPYYRAAGIAHMMIFGGFLVVQLNTIKIWVRGFDEDFDYFGLLALTNPLGAGYNIIKDLFSLLVLVGTSVFVYYRVIKPQKRMTLGVEGLIILGIIAGMMLADLVYDGANIVLHSHRTGEPVHYAIVEPAGSIFGLIFNALGLGDGALNVLRHAGFWIHATLPLVFLNILPYSKHFHIITSIPNVFTRVRQPNKLPTIADLEGKVEREEPIGFVKASDLSWKDVLDLYTCTECGRCSDNCPAYTTEKKLSPKHVTLALRDHLLACEPLVIYQGTASEPRPEEIGEMKREEMHHADPPKDAYFIPNQMVELVPNVIEPDVVWACTTCRACEEQCPVMISYVDKFVQMRRNLVMMKNEFPAELMKPFNGIETNGNPWNMSAMDRANW